MRPYAPRLATLALPLLAALLFPACADAPFAPDEQDHAAAAPAAATTSLWAEADGSYLVEAGDLSEYVDFGGRAHFVVRAIPGDPCRLHVNVAGVEGVGADTGARYRLTGAERFEVPTEYPGLVVAYGSFRVTPTDPCSSCGALFVPVRFTVELDALGGVVGAQVEVGVVD